MQLIQQLILSSFSSEVESLPAVIFLQEKALLIFFKRLIMILVSKYFLIIIVSNWVVCENQVNDGNSNYSWKNRFRYKSREESIETNPYLQVEGNDYAWIGDDGSETSTTVPVTIMTVNTIDTPTASPGSKVTNKEKGLMAFTEEDVHRGINASRAFGSLLFQLLSEFQGDFVFSPISLSILMTIIWSSSEGETSNEISESLPWKECCSLSSLNDVQKTFHAVANTTSKELINSNFLFVHEGKRVNSVFLQSCQNLYNIKVRAIDSSSASETDESIVNVLNRKTKSRTLSCSLSNDNHWKENDPGVVLVGSSYFYARFPPNEIQSMATVFLPFFVLGKMKIQTEYLLMFWNEGFSVWRANTMHAFIIQIPLENNLKGNYSLLILLPDQDQTLNRITEHRLFLQDILQTINGTSSQEIKKKTLVLPKFLLRKTIYLHEYLPFLGMINAFDSDSAQLTTLSSYERLSISGFFHEAILDIDMTTVPTAPVDNYIPGNSEGKSMVAVDRPFMYAVFDSTLNAIIFLGRASAI